MLSKNQVKLIQKLQQKKYRNELNLFIVEGKKSIVEFRVTYRYRSVRHSAERSAYYLSEQRGTAEGE